MIHRAIGQGSVVLDEVEFTIHPGITYDDSDPQVRAIVERFPHLFETDNADVERATAAPGEKRTVKRG